MRKAVLFALCACASLAFAAEREIPYEELHGPFARVAAIPDGTYFRLATRFVSKDPAVPTKDIRLVIRARAGDIPVPVAADGLVRFPVRGDLLNENPPVATNVADGKLQLQIQASVQAPPAERFRYEQMVAMQDEVEGIMSRQSLMVRLMLPDFEGLLIAYPPGTAATATVEAAKPETFKADAEGNIRIPDRKAWRKENPWVQLSAMPQSIGLALD